MQVTATNEQQLRLWVNSNLMAGLSSLSNTETDVHWDEQQPARQTMRQELQHKCAASYQDWMWHLCRHQGLLALMLSGRLPLLGGQLLLQVCRATGPQRPVSLQLGLGCAGGAARPAQLLLAPLLPLLQGRW